MWGCGQASLLSPCPAEASSCAYECDLNKGALPDKLGASTAWPGPGSLEVSGSQAELLFWACFLVETCLTVLRAHLRSVLQTTFN
ncbi:hypothetical protein I79_017885 [Cricetulus griseus]|uniref:Uncharacterized protein n=1 Tax=Cricetulus griseus TaxID=10029 RepID=G3I384_CRIGR|nr:hypothetical protein I79_017885 [Cricetulus griseus]